jgi:hypothetical protein
MHQLRTTDKSKDLGSCELCHYRHICDQDMDEKVVVSSGIRLRWLGGNVANCEL